MQNDVWTPFQEAYRVYYVMVKLRTLVEEIISNPQIGKYR